MKAAIPNQAIKQLFTEAQTAHAFVPHEISDEKIREIYDLFKWGPTAFNAQHGRYLFLKSDAAKERLFPALMPGNIPQVQSASLTIVVAYDTQFFEHLPTVFPAYDAKPIYENNPALSQENGFRNSALQGAYLMMAIRSLGLDCGAMSGFDADKLNGIFFQDGRYKVNFLITVGVADPAGIYPRNPRLSFEQVAQIL